MNSTDNRKGKKLIDHSESNQDDFLMEVFVRDMEEIAARRLLTMDESTLVSHKDMFIKYH